MTDQIPCSPEAEEALIGSILINPEVLKEVENVDPEDFYIERNKWVYLTMLNMRHSGQDIDYLTVITALEKAGKLNEIGGAARITNFINTTVSSLHAESYANIIREKASRRRLVMLAAKLTKAAFDDTQPVTDTTSTAIDSLAKSIVTFNGARHISTYVSELYDQIDEASKNPKDIYGLPTGFPDWDRITYGLQLGEVVRLGGEPGVGKSVLLGQLLVNLASAGIPVALYEMEMKGVQVARRQLSMISKIRTHVMRSGKLRDEDWPVLTNGIEMLADLPIYICDASIMTTAEFRVDLQRLISQYGVQMVGIDYEVLFADQAATTNDRRALISNRVHGIIKDQNLACVSIGDMSKSGIRGEVTGQGALAGTARESHNDDNIMLMRKTDQDDLISVTWEKFREGESARHMNLLRAEGLPYFKSVTKEPVQAQHPRRSTKRNEPVDFDLNSIEDLQ
jgi:replicative DNA helicase